jgi:hypothetical protein
MERSHRRRLLLAVELAFVGLLGAMLAVAVAGTVTREVGPFNADLSLHASLTGGTQVAVPPLGQLFIDTHDGPVRLEVGINQLRPDAARSIATNPNALRGLGAEVDDDLRAGVRDLLLRTAVVTVVGAAALGLLVFRQVRRTLAAAASGAAALLVIGGVTALTADSRSLAEPRFTGLLASAPGAVGDVRDILASVDAYGVQLGRLVVNVTDLYRVTSGLQTFVPDDGTLRVLHISDLHLNPTSYEIVESVVEQFGVDVVVDTGDSTDLGTTAELPYVNAIGRLDVPYVWIRGNHDSRWCRTPSDRQPNATVLDGPQVAEVAGIRFLGQGDPRYIRDSETAARRPPRSWSSSVRSCARPGRGGGPARPRPHPRPRHERSAARRSARRPGRPHPRAQDRDGGRTTLLVQGSTGGAGLRALRGEEATPVTLTVLYLDRADRQLQAYDDITLGGVGASDARISRTVVVEQEEPAPAPSPTPSG